MHRFHTVAFDLDGTLADTAPDLAASLNHGLAALGRDAIEPGRVRHLIGDGARALVRKGLAESGDVDDALVDRCFALFRDHYSDNICNGSTCYPGIDAALDTLAEGGAKLALCTNKSEGLAHKLLDALGWSARFDSVVGGDTLAVKKPDPAPLLKAVALAGGGPAVFVGDSIIDAGAARAAGIPFVAVSFGFAGRPIGELDADAVIDHYSELPAALARL